MSDTNEKPITLARLARGPNVLIGPALILVLVAFPVVLFLPLLTTRFWFYSRNDLVLLRGVYDLFYADRFLFVVVFVFGMLTPIVKMIVAVLCWYQFDPAFVIRHAERLSQLGKLSMLDIMLLAIFVIAFKGVGIGTVEIKFGLYAYSSLVVSSLFLGFALKKAAVEISGSLRPTKT